MSFITILLNGAQMSCAPNTSVLAFLTDQNIGQEISQNGVAVAKNGTILAKPLWDDIHLQNNDKLDIFTLVAGG
ncbi:sulfur carrier protein [Alteromonas sp. 76-1]|uniref:sulfur carrier protein ThiS n=1 Tax=Alteromonas sp. 76-1 TaxID=2358187 RepID=UPI000FD183B3|nr:sulfur carrier protein ThiS [Alteromonas sp. 76-1]VEL95193.1 sulfur carrier protein [Alteromonas sp. 76-1]